MLFSCERYQKLAFFSRASFVFFGNLLVAGNYHVAFRFTAGLPAVVVTSDHHIQPQTLCPLVSVSFFQGFLGDFPSGWPNTILSCEVYISWMENSHSICCAKFWKCEHSQHCSFFFLCCSWVHNFIFLILTPGVKIYFLLIFRESRRERRG